MKKIVIAMITVFFIIGFGFNNSMAQQKKIFENMKLGGQLGVVLPDEAIKTNVATTIGFGLFVQAELNNIIPNIPFVLAPKINFWNSEFNFKGNSFGDVWELSFGLDILYQIPANLPVKPYAGGGLGTYIRHISSGAVSDSDFNLGIKFLGGVKYPVTQKIDAFGEVNLKFGGTTTFSIMIGGLFNLSI